MGFGEMMAADVGAVFLREFAERREIAGREVECVVDNAGDGEKAAERGLSSMRCRVHARSDDLAGIAACAGDTIAMDGQVWTVDGRTDECGMAVIDLSRNI